MQDSNVVEKFQVFIKWHVDTTASRQITRRNAEIRRCYQGGASVRQL